MRQTLRMDTSQTLVRRGAVISSLRVEKNPQHWHIHIWNRGGKSGTICVNAEDGPLIVARLGGSESWSWEGEER